MILTIELILIRITINKIKYNFHLNQNNVNHDSAYEIDLNHDQIYQINLNCDFDNGTDLNKDHNQ